MKRFKKIRLIIGSSLNLTALILGICSFATETNLWVPAVICIALGALIECSSDIIK